MEYIAPILDINTLLYGAASWPGDCRPEWNGEPTRFSHAQFEGQVLKTSPSLAI